MCTVQVISSGLSYVIVRTAKNDFSGQKGAGDAANLQLGPEGSLPASARYQPLQVHIEAISACISACSAATL